MTSECSPVAPTSAVAQVRFATVTRLGLPVAALAVKWLQQICKELCLPIQRGSLYEDRKTVHCFTKGEKFHILTLG